MKVPQVRQVYYNIFVESALSNTSEKAKDPKDRGSASLAYFETYCVLSVLGSVTIYRSIQSEGDACRSGLIVALDYYHAIRNTLLWQSNATVDDEQIGRLYRLKDV
ncbi:hypothetical protein RIR_jg32324.t1 [Rhizophagus irregularis DAOM 181602=DAOM 197198]|nr:hypothetical protein RIR_jg32324.t1 [Rhizophagus irregularis DAOM 181602=DAOM 197198]